MGYSKNEFYFRVNNSSNVLTFNYECAGHEIGNSSDWGSAPTVSYSNGNMLLTIDANRDGSETVAKKFKNATGGEAFGCDTADSLPGELNFYVRGNIVFVHKGTAFIAENICIGQGHNTRMRNNWWIGGKEMTKDGNKRATLTLFSKGKSLKLIFSEREVNEIAVDITEL